MQGVKRKRRCEIQCKQHLFSLRRAGGNPKYDISLTFCPKYQRQPLPPQHTYPVFNNDEQYYTSAFVLGLDKKTIAKNLQKEMLDHNKLIKESLEKYNQIIFPKPNSKHTTCSVCKEQYANYYHHIFSDDHSDRIQISAYNEYIKQLCNMFRPLWDGCSEKADMMDHQRRTREKAQAEKREKQELNIDDILEEEDINENPSKIFTDKLEQQSYERQVVMRRNQNPYHQQPDRKPYKDRESRKKSINFAPFFEDNPTKKIFNDHRQAVPVKQKNSTKFSGSVSAHSHKKSPKQNLKDSKKKQNIFEDPFIIEYNARTAKKKQKKSYYYIKKRQRQLMEQQQRKRRIENGLDLNAPYEFNLKKKKKPSQNQKDAQKNNNNLSKNNNEDFHQNRNQDESSQGSEESVHDSMESQSDEDRAESDYEISEQNYDRRNYVRPAGKARQMSSNNMLFNEVSIKKTFSNDYGLFEEVHKKPVKASSQDSMGGQNQNYNRNRNNREKVKKSVDEPYIPSQKNVCYSSVVRPLLRRRNSEDSSDSYKKMKDTKRNAPVLRQQPEQTSNHLRRHNLMESMLPKTRQSRETYNRELPPEYQSKYNEYLQQREKMHTKGHTKRENNNDSGIHSNPHSRHQSFSKQHNRQKMIEVRNSSSSLGRLQSDEELAYLKRNKSSYQSHPFSRSIQPDIKPENVYYDYGGSGSGKMGNYHFEMGMDFGGKIQGNISQNPVDDFGRRSFSRGQHVSTSQYQHFQPHHQIQRSGINVTGYCPPLPGWEGSYYAHSSNSQQKAGQTASAAKQQKMIPATELSSNQQNKLPPPHSSYSQHYLSPLAYPPGYSQQSAHQPFISHLPSRSHQHQTSGYLQGANLSAVQPTPNTSININFPAVYMPHYNSMHNSNIPARHISSSYPQQIDPNRFSQNMYPASNQFQGQQSGYQNEGNNNKLLPYAEYQEFKKKQTQRSTRR